jgi:hypothetical protein
MLNKSVSSGHSIDQQVYRIMEQMQIDKVDRSMLINNSQLS